MATGSPDPLLDEADIALVVRDESGSVVSATRAAHRLLGDDLGDSAIREDGTPWPLGSRPSVIARTTGEAVPEVVLGVARQGRTIWVMETARPLRGGRSVSVFRDVSSEVEGRRDAALTAASSRRLTDHIADAISRHALDGSCLEVTGAIEAVGGVTAEKAAGHHLGELLAHDDDVRAVRAAFSKIAVTGETTTVVFRSAEMPGRYLETRGRLVHHPVTGLPSEILAVTRDVTDRHGMENPLARAEPLFEVAFELSLVAMTMADLDGQIVQANRAALRMAGPSADKLIGSSWSVGLHPDDRIAVVELHESMRSGKVSSGVTRRRYCFVPGEERHFEVHEVLLPRSATGSLADGPRVFAQVIELTERGEATRADATGRFSDAFDSASVGMVLVDSDGRIVDANPALCEMVGRELADLIEQRFVSIAHHDEVLRLANALAADGDTHIEARLDGPSKIAVWASIHVTGVRHQEGAARHRLVQVADITERRRLEDELRHLADHDPLTGLANRRAFNRALSDHMARCARYGPTGAVMLIDLDKLKGINDSRGHAAGDEALAQTARAMRSRLRTSDTIARLGGDEFAVLLPVVSEEDVRTVAGSLVEAVRAVAGASISIGVALVMEACTAEEVLGRADQAMYEVKRRGGGDWTLDIDEQ